MRMNRRTLGSMFTIGTITVLAALPPTMAPLLATDEQPDFEIHIETNYDVDPDPNWPTEFIMWGDLNDTGVATITGHYLERWMLFQLQGENPGDTITIYFPSFETIETKGNKGKGKNAGKKSEINVDEGTVDTVDFVGDWFVVDASGAYTGLQASGSGTIHTSYWLAYDVYFFLSCDLKGFLASP